MSYVFQEYDQMMLMLIWKSNYLIIGKHVLKKMNIEGDRKNSLKSHGHQKILGLKYIF